LISSCHRSINLLQDSEKSFGREFVVSSVGRRGKLKKVVGVEKKSTPGKERSLSFVFRVFRFLRSSKSVAVSKNIHLGDLSKWKPNFYLSPANDFANASSSDNALDLIFAEYEISKFFISIEKEFLLVTPARANRFEFIAVEKR
jgi:hypothetical protein